MISYAALRVADDRVRAIDDHALRTLALQGLLAAYCLFTLTVTLIMEARARVSARLGSPACRSSGCQQASSRAPSDTSAGTSTPQRALARSQRGWKAWISLWA